MSELKNCMFQYAIEKEIIFDSDLLTRDEAVKLFEDNKQDFAKRLWHEESPQMCVWVNCKNETSYGDTLFNWCAEDFKVVGGELYHATGINAVK